MKWKGKDGGALRPLADALELLREKAVGKDASSRVTAAAAAVAYDGPMPTVRLRHKKTAAETMVKALEPRMDDEKKYGHTKDKGKEKQAAIRDKLKREFKRNKKAAKREVRVGARSEATKRCKRTPASRFARR